MMNSTAIASGIIASSIVLDLNPPFSGDNLMGGYFTTPDREDGSTGGFNISAKVWPSTDVPSGFTGKSARFAGSASADYGMMNIHPTDPGIYLGGGDFTLEGMFKNNGVPGSNHVLLGNYYSSSAYQRYWLTIIKSSHSVDFVFRTKVADVQYTAKYVIGSGGWNAFWNAGWHHIVAQRKDDVITVYLDGVAGGTSITLSPGEVIKDNDTMAFMFSGGAYSATRPFYGWMDEVRLSVGVARYPSAPFTPPTTNHPRGVADADWAKVTVLLGFDNQWGLLLGGIAGFTVEDVLYPTRSFGNSVSGVSKQGIASRTATRFSIPTNTSMDLEGDDFTFETEIYRNSNGSYVVFSAAAAPFPIEITGSGATSLVFRVKDSAGTVLWTDSHDQVIGITNKYAIVRDGANVYFYVDGAKLSTKSISGNVAKFSASDILIQSPTASYHCYMQGFRISRGARYFDASYTPIKAPKFLT